MSRKRKKPKTVSLAPIGRASGKVNIQPVEYEDPYEPGKKMSGVKNVETTPLDAEFHRKALSEDQWLAGNRLLVLFEKTEIGGAKAIRYDIPKVDVSHSHKDIAIGADEARKRLDDVRGYVGRRSYELLVSIVGNRLSVDSLASSEPQGWRRDRLSYHIRRCLSDSLQEVADFLGIAAKGRVGRPVRVASLEDAA